MEELKQKKLFKITNETENHHGFQYHDGLNILKEPFSETGSCVPGGLYFTDAKNILDFRMYGVHLREVQLPFDDPELFVVKDNNKWRANKIILGKKYNLNDPATYEYLVSLGINLVDDNILEFVSEMGYIDVVKYLLKLDIEGYLNINFALDKALNYRHYGLVKYFFSKGADCDHAMWNACFNGKLDAVKYLISIGFNVYADDCRYIQIAIKCGHIDIVEYLVSLVSVFGILGNDFTLSCEPKDYKMVKYLVSLKIDFGQYKNSVLKIVSKSGDLDLVKYFVSNGADVTTQNNYPVRHAGKDGYLDVVKYLVSAGADICAAQNYVVRMACKNKYFDIILYYILLDPNNMKNKKYVRKWANKYSYLKVVDYIDSLDCPKN